LNKNEPSVPIKLFL